MSAPDRKTEATEPMRGEIQGETIPELRRTVLLQAGRVQFATSSDRDDRFNQVLINAGVIRLKDLLRAVEVALATRDRLGEVLVKMKMMTAADVEKHVRTQVRQIDVPDADVPGGVVRRLADGGLPGLPLRLGAPPGLGADAGVSGSCAVRGRSLCLTAWPPSFTVRPA